MWSGISLHMYVQFKSINILLGSDDDNEVFIHFSSGNFITAIQITFID